MIATVIELKSEKSNAHHDAVRSVAFSPDGTKIVSASSDQTIKIWDVANPRPYNASEWESREGKLPGFENSWDPAVMYWQNNVTGDVRRDDSSAGVLFPTEPVKVWDGAPPTPPNLLGAPPPTLLGGRPLYRVAIRNCDFVMTRTPPRAAAPGPVRHLES